MGETGPLVVMLAGRLEGDEASRIGRLVERLGRRGFSIQIVCVAGRAVSTPGVSVIEAPGLAHRWLRLWVARRLVVGEDGRLPVLIHVLDSELGEAGLILAERWRVPYLRSVEEFLPTGGRLRLSRKWCRGLIVSSRELGEELTLELGVPPEWLVVVPPAVELPERPPPTLPIERLTVVGTAGPMVHGSGFPTFLDAARQVVEMGRDVEFVIGGRGPLEPDLRRRADRLGIADRVTFADEPELEGAFWKVLDLFCLPSTTPTVGRTLTTARAFGLATITTDIAGLRALSDEGPIGLSVPAGDPDALSRAILQLLDDRSLAETFGRRGLAWVARQFDPEREADDLAALYRRVLNAEPSALPAAT